MICTDVESQNFRLLIKSVTSTRIIEHPLLVINTSAQTALQSYCNTKQMKQNQT